MNATQQQILGQLITKTKARKAKWATTAASEQFVLRMSSGSVLLDRYEGGALRLILMNKDGAHVVSLQAKKNDPDYRELGLLWSEVVESFYRIEETVSNMLKELRESDEVGGGETPAQKGDDDQEDDLPF